MARQRKPMKPKKKKVESKANDVKPTSDETELKTDEPKLAKKKNEWVRRSARRLVLTYNQVDEDLTFEIVIDQLEKNVGFFEYAKGREPHKKKWLPFPRGNGWKEKNTTFALPRSFLSNMGERSIKLIARKRKRTDIVNCVCKGGTMTQT